MNLKEHNMIRLSNHIHMVKHSHNIYVSMQLIGNNFNLQIQHWNDWLEKPYAIYINQEFELK